MNSSESLMDWSLMRKILILLFAVFALSSCEESMTDEEGVVQMVEYNSEGNSDQHYYHVYVKGGTRYSQGYHLYTNTKYSIGDKIVIK